MKVCVAIYNYISTTNTDNRVINPTFVVHSTPTGDLHPEEWRQVVQVDTSFLDPKKHVGRQGNQSCYIRAQQPQGLLPHTSWPSVFPGCCHDTWNLTVNSGVWFGKHVHIHWESIQTPGLFHILLCYSLILKRITFF